MSDSDPGSSGDEERKSGAGSPVASNASDSDVPNKSAEAGKSPQDAENSPDESPKIDAPKDSPAASPAPKVAPDSEDSDSGGLTMKVGAPSPVVASDSEGGDSDGKGDSTPAAQVSQKDLFGDDADLSSSDDDAHKKKGDGEKDRDIDDSDDNENHGIRMHIPDDEGEPIDTAPAETVIQVEVPKIEADLGTSLHFVKFPNFLSVEPRPFDEENYEDEIDEDEVLDEEGRSRLKLKVENTIRWRHVTDSEGNVIKQSNAKIVRWSDGTMSCYLGAEIFDVHVQPTSGDFNHLFVRQGAGLQGQAVFRTKLTFRPHSTDTMTHRKMTLSMADRTSKAQKVKVLAEVGKNPEKEKEELVRREEERLRASARRETQQRRIRERAQGKGLSRDMIEHDEYSEEDETSLNAIKKSYKQGAQNHFSQGIRDLTTADSDDDSDRLEKAKKLDSDDEGGPSSSAPKKRKIIDDDDEEDDD